jgi:hypothetical protein
MYVHGKSEHVLQKYKKVCHMPWENCHCFCFFFFFTSLGKSQTQNYSTFQPRLIQYVPNLNRGHISPKFPAKHTRFIWVVEHMRSGSRFQVVQFIIVTHLRQIFITFIIVITCQNNFKQIWKAKKVYGLGRILLLYLDSNSELKRLWHVEIKYVIKQIEISN